MLPRANGVTYSGKGLSTNHHHQGGEGGGGSELFATRKVGPYHLVITVLGQEAQCG